MLQVLEAIYLGKATPSSGGGTSGADTSLSNLTAAGKERVSHLTMPGDNRIDLSLVGPDVLMTAPSDGYIIVAMTDSQDYLHGFVLSSDATSINDFPSRYTFVIGRYGIQAGRFTCPISKGQKFAYLTSNGQSAQWLKFIYARGSEPTQGA